MIDLAPAVAVSTYGWCQWIADPHFFLQGLISTQFVGFMGGLGRSPQFTHCRYLWLVLHGGIRLSFSLSDRRPVSRLATFSLWAARSRL